MLFYLCPVCPCIFVSFLLCTVKNDQCDTFKDLRNISFKFYSNSIIALTLFKTLISSLHYPAKKPLKKMIMKYDINLYIYVPLISFFCISISFQVLLGFLKIVWLLIKFSFCLMQEFKCFRVTVNKKMKSILLRETLSIKHNIRKRVQEIFRIW